MSKLGILMLLILAPLTSVRADDVARLPSLMTCFRQLMPFTTVGNHATVYPGNQNFIFLPGSYDDKDGVYVYSDRGVSFVSIASNVSNQAISFEVYSSTGAQSVVYQPGATGKPTQVWLRGKVLPHTLGTATVFKAMDDHDRRVPLETELDSMIQSMAKSWDQREDQLVQAVEEGKYLWVEVDLDHYKDAATRCEQGLNQAAETSQIRASIRSELEALSSRASHPGVLKEQAPQTPSSFLTAPQY